MKFTVRVADRVFEVEVGDLHVRPIVAKIEGEEFRVWPEETKMAKSSDTPPNSIGKTLSAETSITPATQAPHSSRRTSSGEEAISPGKSGQVVYAPIPGVIDAIFVQPGEMVTVGQELCVLEAMKMKNVIRARHEGQIATVQVSIGQHVKHNDVLIAFAE